MCPYVRTPMSGALPVLYVGLRLLRSIIIFCKLIEIIQQLVLFQYCNET